VVYTSLAENLLYCLRTVYGEDTEPQRSYLLVAFCLERPKFLARRFDFDKDDAPPWEQDKAVRYAGYPRRHEFQGQAPSGLYSHRQHGLDLPFKHSRSDTHNSAGAVCRR